MVYKIDLNAIMVTAMKKCLVYHDAGRDDVKKSDLDSYWDVCNEIKKVKDVCEKYGVPEHDCSVSDFTGGENGRS